MASWIFQGNPDRFEVDAYLLSGDQIYWSVTKYADRIGIDDTVYIWRSSGQKKGISGIVAKGIVNEEVKAISDVSQPEYLMDGLWTQKDDDVSEIKVGISLINRRLTPNEGMLTRNSIKKTNEFIDSQIIKAHTGTNFLLNKSQADKLHELWEVGKSSVSPSSDTDNGNSPNYSTALFINGIYDSVLTEILDAQEGKGSAQNFLQPYKGQMIKMLARQMPTPENPIRLYLSTSENLSQICYTADIIGWEDKRQLIDNRRRKLIQHFEKFQPGELDLFSGTEKVGNTAVNLILIRNLKLLDTLHSTSLLIKASDGLPLKKRTRAGGWSEVFELGNLIELESVIQERYDSDLTSSIDNSFALSNTLLEERLNKASVMPDKVQVVSVGYRRNPDVIVAVQRRAKGLCERCGKNAPFLRRTDGSPYLEVHHWKPLSKGGEDTVENAAALCPNCHREVHHGRLDEELGK